MATDKIPAGFEGVTPYMIIKDASTAIAFYHDALAAGGRKLRPLTDQFYDDRSGTLVDPFGHVWTVATRIEDVSPAELQRRLAKIMAERD